MKWRIVTHGQKFIVQRQRFWFWFWDTATVEIDFGHGPDAVVSIPRVFECIDSAKQFITKVRESEGATIWKS